MLCLKSKDYNHPSVVMYSIGNEISELGTKEGQALCKEIADFVKEKDGTRAVTCGINLMLASMAAKGRGIYGKKKGGKENTNGSAGMDNMPTSTFYNILMNMLNGKTIGTKKVKECKAVFKNVVYEPGKLSAISYQADGTKTGESTLMSATGRTQILAKADKPVLTANGQDLCFVEITLAGENGVIKSSADQELTVAVNGAGCPQGLGSARPNTEESFLGNSYTTYYGNLLAVVRAQEVPGEILIKITGKGLEEKEIKLRSESRK